MSKLFICISLLGFFSTGTAIDDIENIDLLQVDTYIWNGYSLGNTVVKVTAENFYISVTIDTCDIGNELSRPNEEYLIMREGNDDETATEEGRIFAYIKKPKKLYFYSSSVVLELKTPKPLEKSCKVIFRKGDVEDTTLPPVTTTENVPTLTPDISKYSTVLISGKSIDEFNHDKNLAPKLKQNLADMATQYTKLEGFCLKGGIKPEDVEIHILEQCPAKWPNFETCVRLIYALPIKIDESCSLWKGYQLTQEHLDIMWARMAETSLKNGFEIYKEPSVDKVVTWWIISIVLVTVVFIGAIITINLYWKRRQILRRAKAHQNEDFMPEMRQVSDTSLTPPCFQSIPPMFDKMNRTDRYSEERHGTENKAFEYDELPASEEDGTII